MADIRIKDLTTTASSSASDDFIAVDGTTNGTRKLNAFSPTFGGNATVTGTLTGNSTATIAGRVISNASSTATDAAGFAHVTGYSSGGKTYTGFSAGGIAVNQSAAFGYVYDSGTPANSFAHITPYGSTEGSLFKFSPAGVLTLGATTASTSTSTGALVVSGGVGIAKALFAGESAYFAGAVGATDAVLKNGFGRSANGYAYFDLVGDTTYTDYGMRLLRGNSGANAISQIAHRGTGTLEVVTVDAAPIAFFTNGSNLALTITSGQQVQCNATTASTTTTSGALVVGNGTSGGLGVGGAINAGSTITSTNGSGSGLLGMRSSSGNASYVFWSETGVADRGILGFNNGSSTLSYRSFSSSFATGTEVFAITSGGNVTAGGSVQTAAPSGGTAAAWKLGTVATVSPTSPNRTIEVDIGGTIYYIHAKTTNN